MVSGRHAIQINLLTYSAKMTLSATGLSGRSLSLGIRIRPRVILGAGAFHLQPLKQPLSPVGHRQMMQVNVM